MTELLGPATVQYTDFRGTSAFDGHAGVSDAGLHALAGLDPNEWAVVGFEVGGGERYVGGFIYAVKRSALEGTNEGIAGLAESDGAVPAERFPINEDRVRDWLAGFKRWSIVATFKGVAVKYEPED